MSKTLFSFGHGYSARALAARLIPQGWRIIGTTRNADSVDEIRASGVEPLLWPEDDCTEALDAATHLLVSAGPSSDGDPLLGAMRDQITKAATRLDWVGYLSTISVYGDHGGAWVDETTPVNPALERGYGRAKAEADWLAIPDLPVHVFRLAGIYGPGRGPLAKVRNGTARRIIKPGQVFSRTHVEDIAQVLEASINRPNPGAIYNVCDDEPAPPQDVLAYAAELLGVEPPPEVSFEAAEMSPMARSFYAENRRVSNKRIKEELGVELLYPGYREGLKALANMKASTTPFS